MKLIHILFASSIFAQELPFAKPELPNLSERQLPPDPTNKGTIYFRAITDSDPVNKMQVIPGLGFGYRRTFGKSGIDVSMNYSQGDGVRRHRGYSVWTIPKVSYLYYSKPESEKSLYGGFGLSWGGVHAEEIRDNDDEENFGRWDHSTFIGLIPHVAVGYEVLRHSYISSFAELTVSQPLFPSYLKGSMPGPVAEVSIGAGF